MKKKFFPHSHGLLSHMTMLAVLATTAAWSMAANAQEVAPDAGVQIHNVARAGFSDANGSTLEVYSNTVVTTVAHVYAVNLSDATDKEASANKDVYYPFNLYNTGNGEDKFVLSAATGDADITGIDLFLDPQKTGKPGVGQQPISLLGGTTYTTAMLQRYLKAQSNDLAFVIRVSTRSSATAGKKSFTVTAVSSGDAEKKIVKTGKLQIVAGAAFDVGYVDGSKAVVLNPNETAEVKIEVKNTGSTDGPVYIEQLLPAGASDFLDFADPINVTVGNAKYSEDGEYNGKSLVIHTPTASDKKMGVAFWMKAGATTKVGFTVKLKSDAARGTFELITAKYGVSLLSSTDATKPTLAFVDNRSSETSPLRFDVKNTHDFTVKGGDPVPLTMPGVETKFTYTVKNEGSTAAEYKLKPDLTALPEGTHYKFTVGGSPVFDGDSEVGPTITVPPTSSVDVDMLVTLPLKTAATSAVTKVTMVATSNDDPKLSHKATIDLNAIKLAEGSLTKSGSGAVKVDPKKHGNVILTLTNKNPLPVTDLYTLKAEVAGDAATAVTFYNVNEDGTCGTTLLPSTVRVDANATRNICADITPMGNQHQVTVSFTAESKLKAKFGLEVTFDGTDQAINLFGNRTGTVAAGATHVYSQLLENKGNTVFATNALKIAATNSLSGWKKVEIYYDPNRTQSVSGNGVVLIGDDGRIPAALPVDGALPILVSVTAAASAVEGDINDSVVSVTTVEDDALLATATIATTVTPAQIDITLKQTDASTANCAAVVVPGDDKFKTSVSEVVPGGCLWYRAEAVNTGDDAVTSVKLTGEVPSHTTYVPQAGLDVTVNGNVVTVTKENLSPQQKAQLTYKVKVNDAP